MTEVITQDSIEVIVFGLDDSKTNRKENYGVDIKQVQEIRNVESITRLPKSPDYVKGIMNLRGKIITVIDIRTKLGFSPKEEDSNSSILISKINEQLIGFLIDDVDEVLRIDTKDLDDNAIESMQSADYLKGFAKTKDRLVILLDLEKLISSDDIANMEASS